MAKKNNGYYRQTFTFNGKRYYARGKTIKEAVEKAAEMRANLERGVEDISNPTLDDYYDHFTSIRKREIKESTLRSQTCQYKVVSAVEMAPGMTFGSLRIKDITRRDIETAREILLQQGKTPQNLNNIFAHLNHVFSKATLDDTIPKNPCKSLTQLKRSEPLIGENRHRALSVAETEKFINCAIDRESYYLNTFLMMLKTGMRIGEVTALYKTDIDRKKGFIHIRRTIQRNEFGQYIVGEDAKTENSKRDIPLRKDVLEIINQQENQNRIFFGLEAENGLIFRSVDNKILREYSVNREIKRICTACGIEPFTCHAFRNTFATRFIEQNAENYKTLSEILGHKKVEITLDLYTHVMQETKIECMNSLII